jgi:hypothetical protein
VATGALRELCLYFYDARAIVAEVCRRANEACGGLASAEQWQRQLLALEALQIFAPMGHALGLTSLSAELEDRCFQVSDAQACMPVPCHARQVLHCACSVKNTGLSTLVWKNGVTCMVTCMWWCCRSCFRAHMRRQLSGCLGRGQHTRTHSHAASHTSRLLLMRILLFRC